MTALTSAPRKAGDHHRPGGAPPAAVRSLLRGLPMLPSVVLLAVFLAGPIAYCVYYAFTDMQLTGATGTHLVGLATSPGPSVTPTSSTRSG
ncbi:hypothetical protein SALBM311S_07606 [Streptomyces alboniger]